jgi:hypothetical protein
MSALSVSYRKVMVSITTADGEVLDSFPVCHFRSTEAESEEDAECIGSNATESLLVARIRRYVEVAL